MTRVFFLTILTLAFTSPAWAEITANQEATEAEDAPQVDRLQLFCNGKEMDIEYSGEPGKAQKWRAPESCKKKFEVRMAWSSTIAGSYDTKEFEVQAKDGMKWKTVSNGPATEYGFEDKKAKGPYEFRLREGEKAWSAPVKVTSD